MMLKLIILYCLLGLLDNNVQAQTSPCFILDASAIDKLKELKTDFGSVKQLAKAIHDTIATDLFLRIKDMATNTPLKNVNVIILKVVNKISDSNGITDFIAFGNGGNYTILVSLENYHCIEIDNLHFGTGDIRRLEIKLRKRN
jgi:hypothetical protein